MLFGGFYLQVERSHVQKQANDHLTSAISPATTGSKRKAKKDAILFYGDSREPDLRFDWNKKTFRIKFDGKGSYEPECLHKDEFHFPLNDASAYRVVDAEGKENVLKSGKK